MPNTAKPTTARRRRRRGYSLLEGILGLAILAALIIQVSRFIGYADNTAASRTMATRMSTLSKAADAYVKAYDAQLAAYTQNPGSIVTVPMGDDQADEPLAYSYFPGASGGMKSFVDAGVVGSSFRNRNSDGQKTVFVAFVPPGQDPTKHGYEAFLINYGGKPTPDVVLGGAEGMSEGRVGSVMQADPENKADALGFALRGARGGWAASATSFQTLQGTDIAPVPGHLVSYVTLNRNGVPNSGSAYLCRQAQADDPACNVMNLNLDMGGNNITDVTTIAPAGDTLVIAGNQTVQGTQSVTGDQNVAGNQTVTGTQTAATYYGATGQNYYLKPDGNTYLQTLKADNLNLDAIGQSDYRPSLNDVHLRDLIPTHVIKATVLATDGATIPMPDCGPHPLDSTGKPRAKIFAYPIAQYNVSAPQTSLQWDVNYTEVPVIDDIAVSQDPNNANHFVLTPHPTKVNSINPTDTAHCAALAPGDDNDSDGFCIRNLSTTYTESYNYMHASANGTSSWTLHLDSMATDPTKLPTDHAPTQADIEAALAPVTDRAGARNQALVQTACYYEDSTVPASQQTPTGGATVASGP